MKSINPDVYTAPGYTLKADGSAGSIVGKTAYNVMLNYYDGDYKAISAAIPQDNGVAASLGGEYRPLYNGNIGSMAVSIGALTPLSGWRRGAVQLPIRSVEPPGGYGCLEKDNY